MAKKSQAKKYVGRLTSINEQGTEGTSWCLFEDESSGKTGYDRMHLIEDGDHLKIYHKDKLVFNGKIVPDYESVEELARQATRQYKLKIPLSTPTWVQKGWEMKYWSKLFSLGCRAELEKKRKKVGRS